MTVSNISWVIALLACASVVACGARANDSNAASTLLGASGAGASGGAGNAGQSHAENGTRGGAGGARTAPSGGSASHVSSVDAGDATANGGAGSVDAGGATANGGSGPLDARVGMATGGAGSADARSEGGSDSTSRGAAESGAGGVPVAKDASDPSSDGAGARAAEAGMQGAPMTDAGPPPGRLSRVSLDRVLIGVSDAAWNETTGEFFLLAAAAGEFWRVDPRSSPAATTGPYALPPGVVAPSAFAVSGAALFTIVDDAIVQLSLIGAVTGQPIPLVGSPSPAALTAAYADGWLLVGDAAGPAQALADGSKAVEVLGIDGPTGSPSGLTELHGVTSDGASFAFGTLVGDRAFAHRVQPAEFALNPAPCPLGLTVSLDQPIALRGQELAWVQEPAHGAYLLHVASVPGSVCGSESTVAFGAVPDAAQVVGLVDSTHVIVVTNEYNHVVTIALEDASAGGPYGQPLAGVDLGSGVARKFVVGGRHHALLVSGDRPALVAF